MTLFETKCLFFIYAARKGRGIDFRRIWGKFRNEERMKKLTKSLIVYILLCVFGCQSLVFGESLGCEYLAPVSFYKMNPEEMDRIIEELRHMITRTMKGQREKNLARQILRVLDVEIHQIKKKDLVFNLMADHLQKIQKLPLSLFKRKKKDSDVENLISLVEEMEFETIKNKQGKMVEYAKQNLSALIREKGIGYVVYFLFLEFMGYVAGPAVVGIIFGPFAAALVVAVPWQYPLLMFYNQMVKKLTSLKIRLFPSLRLSDERLLYNFKVQISHFRQHQKRSRNVKTMVRSLEFLLNYYDKHPYLTDGEKENLLRELLVQMNLTPRMEQTEAVSPVQKAA